MKIKKLNKAQRNSRKLNVTQCNPAKLKETKGNPAELKATQNNQIVDQFFFPSLLYNHAVQIFSPDFVNGFVLRQLFNSACCPSWFNGVFWGLLESFLAFSSKQSRIEWKNT